MKKSVKNNNKKNSQLVKKKGSNKKRQQKRSTINGLPIHLDTPRGKVFSCPCADGYILRTTIARQLTLPQLNAMRKCIRAKSVRNLLCIRTQPYLDKTKKPSEVRMGKGRGVKLNVVITPLRPGQIMLETGHPVLVKNSISISLNYRVAAHKLSRGVKILKMDI